MTTLPSSNSKTAFGRMVSYLGDSVDISDLSLGTSGSGDDTQIMVGGNIAPGLRIEYGAGVFTDSSTLPASRERR